MTGKPHESTAAQTDMAALRQYIFEELEPAQNRGFYICPLCGSGTGPNRTGAFKVDPETLRGHCYSCGFHGDVCDLVAARDRIPAAEAIAAVSRRAPSFRGEKPATQNSRNPKKDAGGKDLNGHGQVPEKKAGGNSINDTVLQGEFSPTDLRPKPAGGNSPKETGGNSGGAGQIKTENSSFPGDIRRYIERCAALLPGSPGAQYLASRGFSAEAQREFRLGYDSETRRVVIPYGSQPYYIARGIDPAKKEYRKPVRDAAGEEPVFFAEILEKDAAGSPVFVVESQLCALSILQAGGNAVALGGAGVRRFLRLLEKHPPAGPLLLATDDDEPGRRLAAELEAQLDKAGITHMRVNITLGRKDPNDALQADPAAFEAAVRGAVAEAERSAVRPGLEMPSAAAVRPDSARKYLEGAFSRDIARFKSFSDRKTGFDNLDSHSGGLYPGLYVLGAISSLGKTTFVHQMADQMAERGDHVIYFSLEQSRLELVSKSLSRTTALNDRGSAVSSLAIRKGNITGAVQSAAEAYCRYAERVSVVECSFRTDLNEIQGYVAAYMRANPGITPVVIVDYLQILPPEDLRQSDKEKVDRIVRGLKKLQADRDLVVFLVSSLNRANYLTPIDFESFKESGGIEYTADVVYGLQLRVMNEELFSKEKSLKDKRDRVRDAKSAIPREVELVCLKNRYGIASYRCGFRYDPRYDLFEEDPLYEIAESGGGRRRV